MDREQDDLQHLSFFGICGESIIIISRYPKLFLQITLTLFLPLTCLFLANILLSQDFLLNLQYDGIGLYVWTLNDNFDHHQHNIVYWIIHLTYFTLHLGFSVLSSSAVVYTVTCIHVGKETDLLTVVKFAIIPRVWMRVMVTLIINFVIVLSHCVMTTYLVHALWWIMEKEHVDRSYMGISITLAALAFMMYFASLVYINVVWQLAGTVTVLEEESTCGLRALVKSWALLKGNMVSAFGVFVMINLFTGLVEARFESYVVGDGAGGSGSVKVVYGVLTLLALSVAFMFGLVVETMFYLVCKSFHQERVSKSDLAKRLEGFLKVEYESLVVVKELQLEQV